MNPEKAASPFPPSCSRQSPCDVKPSKRAAGVVCRLPWPSRIRAHLNPGAVTTAAAPVAEPSKASTRRSVRVIRAEIPCAPRRTQWRFAGGICLRDSFSNSTGNPASSISISSIGRCSRWSDRSKRWPLLKTLVFLLTEETFKVSSGDEGQISHRDVERGPWRRGQTEYVVPRWDILMNPAPVERLSVPVRRCLIPHGLARSPSVVTRCSRFSRIQFRATPACHGVKYALHRPRAARPKPPSSTSTHGSSLEGNDTQWIQVTVH
jgi:hypothetical protein